LRLDEEEREEREGSLRDALRLVVFDVAEELSSVMCERARFE
jgi:hypothetical protein